MSVEQFEITSAGLFALLHDDFAEMMAAKTQDSRIAASTKLLRRVRQINSIADTVAGNPTTELAHAVERLGTALVSQAERRQSARARTALKRQPPANTLSTAASS
ncbi:MAG: hypothetical protein JNM66_03555 [Bryobacterales bacterium]|nr:hypothetical protein [Bryobacterales bacterium]